MLKRIACIALLLVSMGAIADKNNGVGVDSQMRYYVINGVYVCNVYPLQQEYERALGMGMLGKAAMIIAGDENKKEIIMQLFTASGERTEALKMPILRLHKASSTLSSYIPIDKKLSKKRAYALISKANQIAYAVK
ncbi:hypothetical protein PSI23_18740 [Xenorhabdus sp. XENO-10]|uniref:Uncharacterized protein n=1 Tax=Xenorhabdus yunnanensis TaxID=3025878 RepID=A0ABT5LN47_9GAMM|nr:hypothetical protein [Xenorhabdus yunnanensis]MDC9591269.1 hypothetical protein [Xenorhabdus yunnanensis]